MGTSNFNHTPQVKLSVGHGGRGLTSFQMDVSINQDESISISLQGDRGQCLLQLVHKPHGLIHAIGLVRDTPAQSTPIAFNESVAGFRGSANSYQKGNKSYLVVQLRCTDGQTFRVHLNNQQCSSLLIILEGLPD
jgi:hypothetical protein